MIQIRKSRERGHFDHGWLNTYHTFSFADYYDPDFMGFRTLRVINEDRVQPSRGFATHGHANMEIITYVIEGALEHKDSLGSGGVIHPGEAQYMSAGTGVRHSEFNASRTDPVHLYQIWILPEVDGAPPRYDQIRFDRETMQDHLLPLASPSGNSGAMSIRQDATLYAARLSHGHTIAYPLASNRHAWIQVVQGNLSVESHALEAGDGAAISAETKLELTGASEAEVLLFDLA